MRKNSEPIKLPIMGTQRSISSNNRDNYKKRQSQRADNAKLIKKLENKKVEKGGQKELISNAYKNVIKVIANLLDNINEEKTNGKSNLKYINEETQNKRKSFNKPLAKKLISSTEQITILSLKKLGKKNSVNESPLFIRKSFNIERSKIKNLIRTENLDTSIHLMKSKKKIPHFQSINRNKLKVNNLFFKPKNKLKTKCISTKTLISDCNKIDNGSSFLSKVSKSNIEESELSNHNKTNNSVSSLLGSEKVINHLKINSQKSNHVYFSGLKDISQKKISSYFKSNIQKSARENRKSSKKIDISPFVHLQKNINIDTETIKQRLYEYENNEITRQIDQLPGDYILKSKKRNQRQKSIDPFHGGLKSIITLKPLRNNYVKNMKQFHKENKYRTLLNKGHVYDSLDDDEESDEEDINIWYLEPDSIILYILDSITFISSLIIMIYFPICLAKRKFFCQYLNKEEFIFYSIDMIYIVDLIINFYRSYYNYNEILIKKNILICIHYFKTWLLLDLISAIPFYSIIKANEAKCIGDNVYKDYKLNNNGKHSNYYNTNIQNVYYLITFLKILKSIKTFKYNLAAKKIKKNILDMDCLNDWGSVILYTFFFFTFLNFGACCFIIIGRNTINNWIYLTDLEGDKFIHIYFGAIHYLIETVTTVGYGDVIGKSINEISFQVIMLIVGTCIYSWLISSISNYVKKKNEKNIKYEEKVQILEEIKLSNPNCTEELYDKILRLLHYRKYHEEETEKNVVLNSIPNSLKNLLVIEMYKSFINGFLFFKGIENREFIVQVISKLDPVLGIKGDVLIQEVEFIEDIIFVKNGVLSLEIWVDLDFPEDSIEDYLIEYGFLNNPKMKKSKKQIINKERSAIIPSTLGDNYTSSIANPNNNKYYIFNEDRTILAVNKKIIKVLDIRKNEHFGDIYMFLNKKSPVYVRVKSNKADLLLLKKLDALKISSNYPNIWKNILKKPLENTKVVNNLSLKALSIFCNFYGIKTKLFKKKKKNNYYPSYYLTPSLNHKKSKYLKKNIKQKRAGEKDNDPFMPGKREGIRLSLRKYIKRLTKKETQKKDEEDNDNDNESSNDTNSNISFEDGDISPNKRRRGGEEQIKSNNFSFSKNKSIDSPSNTTNKQSNNYNESYNKLGSRFTFIKNKVKNNTLIKESDNISKKSKKDNKEEDDSSYNNKATNDNYNESSNICDNNNSNKISKKKLLDIKKPQNAFKIVINRPEEENDSIIKNEFINSDLNLVINNEFYPGELFDLYLFDDEKPKKEKERDIISNSININHTPILKDGVYINNLNIIGSSYLDSSLEKNKGLQEKIKKLEFELKQKKKFDILEISSSESTMSIDSSYENINEISNNKYIYDFDLRDMTKQFIIKKNKFPNKSVNFISRKNKRNSSFDNEHHNKYIKKQILLDKSKSSKNTEGVFSKISFKKYNTNNLMDKFFQSIQNNSKNHADSFIKKVRKLQSSESNIKHSRRPSVVVRPSIHENLLLDRKKSNTFEDEKDFNPKKYEVFAKKNQENISIKKKKKKKELDIIQFNIQKSSQNLNQPDAFYAGLFSQLIFKGSSYENSHIYYNDNNNKNNKNSNNYNNKSNLKDDSSFNNEDDEN